MFPGLKCAEMTAVEEKRGDDTSGVCEMCVGLLSLPLGWKTTGVENNRSTNSAKKDKIEQE